MLYAQLLVLQDDKEISLEAKPIQEQSIKKLLRAVDALSELYDCSIIIQYQREDSSFEPEDTQTFDLIKSSEEEQAKNIPFPAPDVGGFVPQEPYLHFDGSSLVSRAFGALTDPIDTSGSGSLASVAVRGTKQNNNECDDNHNKEGEGA